MPRGVTEKSIQLKIELLLNIPYEEFKQYYIEENHSQVDTMSYFNLDRISDFNILRDAYGCAKDRKSISKTVAENNLKKYGVRNISSLDEVKIKKGQTTQKHYGVDNYSKTDEFKEVLKQTMLDRYGVDSPMKVPEFAAKCGAKVKAGWDSGSTGEKIRNTLLERYGVENSLQLPQCIISGGISKPEQLVMDKLDSLNIEYEREFHIKKYRYDFRVGNILLEINPTSTHNSTWGVFNDNGKEKDYHYNKSIVARDNRYRCIHIFDWDDVDKVLSLLLPRTTVYGRKCVVKETTQAEANILLSKYHIQGPATKQTVCMGLYYDNELISVMTFGKPRYNKKYQWELIRYVSSCNVLGGSNKIWKHFIDKYNPDSIISYCDFSKFTGHTYEKLGMNYKAVNIGKHWYDMKNTHITDNLLRQRGYDQLFNTNYGKGYSNEELMLEHGFVEIYDAGQITYTWNRKSN